jgi:predicted HTH domain antitoxin
MTISFSLPESIENYLRCEFADVGEAIKEAAMVELYRQGTVSHGLFAEALGKSRFEADSILKRHNVTEDLMTSEEFANQLDVLQRKLAE